MDDYHPHCEPINSPAPKVKWFWGQPNSRRKRRKAKLLAADPHCKYCGCLLTEATATIDHVTPRSKGGTNHEANLVLACYPCNLSKGANSLDDWQPGNEKAPDQTA